MGVYSYLCWRWLMTSLEAVNSLVTKYFIVAHVYVRSSLYTGPPVKTLPPFRLTWHSCTQHFPAPVIVASGIAMYLPVIAILLYVYMEMQLHGETSKCTPHTILCFIYVGYLYRAKMKFCVFCSQLEFCSFYGTELYASRCFIVYRRHPCNLGNAICYCTHWPQWYWNSNFQKLNPNLERFHLDPFHSGSLHIVPFVRAELRLWMYMLVGVVGANQACRWAWPDESRRDGQGWPLSRSNYTQYLGVEVACIVLLPVG